MTWPETPLPSAARASTAPRRGRKTQHLAGETQRHQKLLHDIHRGRGKQNFLAAHRARMVEQQRYCRVCAFSIGQKLAEPCRRIGRDDVLPRSPRKQACLKFAPGFVDCSLVLGTWRAENRIQIAGPDFPVKLGCIGKIVRLHPEPIGFRKCDVTTCYRLRSNEVYTRSSRIIARCTMVSAACPISWRLTIPIERRIAIAAPPNRLTTQPRLLHGAGSDAHGFSNGALVRSASNSGPDRADYARGACARRNRRSSHHCVRTQ